MPKLKKTPTYLYGIEITKPHSKLMYAHNEMCADEMKFNIRDAWANEIIKFMGDDEWPTESNKYNKIIDIQRSVCATGFGEGFTIDEVNKDFLSNLSDMANWQLHEEYSYMSFKNLVPRTRFMMLGFNVEADYDFCTDIDLSPVLTEVHA
jgi:hypothetical protein